MKKTGILNADLICELTKIRHLDKLVICDAGFPIPKGSTVVDVSLVEGIPTFMQTLKAVLNEIIVEAYVIFANMETANPEYYEQISGMFVNLACKKLPMAEFIEEAKEAKLFIRTGEFKPTSNIILTSATGVRAKNQIYDISFDVIE